MFTILLYRKHRIMSFMIIYFYYIIMFLLYFYVFCEDFVIYLAQKWSTVIESFEWDEKNCKNGVFAAKK